MLVRLLLIFSSLFCTVGAWAQQSELIDRTFSGSSKEVNPQDAKRVIQEDAAEQISADVIKELIGEERYNKNKSLIHSKIIKFSPRYIPFSKPTALVQEGADYKMSVAVKVSLRDLKTMLQENGLLNDNDAIPVVLPMISLVDRVQGRSFRWWLPGDRTSQAFLMKESRLLEDSLRDGFQKNNFYVIRPMESGLGAGVPSDFHAEKINAEDATFFAQYFNAPVIIDGQVNLTKADTSNMYRIEIRMTAMQVSNGRAIADVSRRYDTAVGSFESVVDKKFRDVVEAAASDLSSQVLEASQRGSLGTSILRVTVNGRSSLPQVEAVKEKIRSQLTQVKGIRERSLGAEAVSFEVDTAITPAELAGKIEALDYNGRRLSKVGEQSNEIIFKWAQ